MSSATQRGPDARARVRPAGQQGYDAQFAGVDLAERFPARGVRLARMIPIQPGRDEMVNDFAARSGALPPKGL